MKKLISVTIILSILSLTMVLNVKAGGHTTIYYAGSLDSQVYRALERMGIRITFVSNPTEAEVFALNGIIPDDRLIAKQVQSGVSELVLFLSPEIKAEQIQNLLGIQNQISLTETNEPVSLKYSQQYSNIADAHTKSWLNSWMGGIDWSTAPKINNLTIISGTSFTSLIETNTDHSTILEYTPPYDIYSGFQHSHRFIFQPFLDQYNQQFQHLKYFD